MKSLVQYISEALVSSKVSKEKHTIKFSTCPEMEKYGFDLDFMESFVSLIEKDKHNKGVIEVEGYCEHGELSVLFTFDKSKVQEFVAENNARWLAQTYINNMFNIYYGTDSNSTDDIICVAIILIEKRIQELNYKAKLNN